MLVPSQALGGPVCFHTLSPALDAEGGKTPGRRAQLSPSGLLDPPAAHQPPSLERAQLRSGGAATQTGVLPRHMSGLARSPMGRSTCQFQLPLMSGGCRPCSPTEAAGALQDGILCITLIIVTLRAAFFFKGPSTFLSFF